MKQSPFWRLLSHIQDFGLSGLHFRFLAGLNLYRELSIYRLDLKHHRPDLKAKISIAVSTNSNNAEPESQHNETCFTARHKGEIVACLKRSEDSCELAYIHQQLRLAPGECYLHAAFTQPAYRSQGMLGELISHACQPTKYTVAWVAIVSYNQHSIKAFAKAGFKLKEIRGYYGLGPWKHHFPAQPEPKENTRSSNG